MMLTLLAKRLAKVLARIREQWINNHPEHRMIINRLCDDAVVAFAETFDIKDRLAFCKAAKHSHYHEGENYDTDKGKQS